MGSRMNLIPSWQTTAVCFPHSHITSELGFGVCVIAPGHWMVGELMKRMREEKVIRRNDQPDQPTNLRLSLKGDLYFFYDKKSGAVHFHVLAGPGGRFPVDQAAGLLLAMHCRVRGKRPDDYVVMVQAEVDHLEDLND